MTHPSTVALPRFETVPALHCALESEVRFDISDFDADQWDALVSRDEPQLRHDFLLAAQQSGLMRNPRYVTVNRAGRLVGAAVLSDNDIDLLTLAAPQLKKMAAKIRRGPLRRLGILRAQTCGPVITNCRPNLIMSSELSIEAKSSVSFELIKLLDKAAKAPLLVFFELDERTSGDFGAALEKYRHIKAASLPGTKIRIEPEWHDLEGYVGAMRKLYRRAVRDDQAKGQGLDIRIESDFTDLADEVFVLYSNVLARAQSTFETLTPEFFRAFASCADSRLVTARLKETGQLVGIEMLLLGDNMVQDLYTGVDYRYNESHSVYFNLAYPAIDLACREGLQFVSTGQTSYKFKSRLGVEPFPLSVYIKHRNPLLNALLARIHPLICPEVPTFEHRVFKSEAHHVNMASKSQATI